MNTDANSPEAYDRNKLHGEVWIEPVNAGELEERLDWALSHAGSLDPIPLLLATSEGDVGEE